MPWQIVKNHLPSHLSQRKLTHIICWELLLVSALVYGAYTTGYLLGGVMTPSLFSERSTRISSSVSPTSKRKLQSEVRELIETSGMYSGRTTSYEKFKHD